MIKNYGNTTKDAVGDEWRTAALAYRRWSLELDFFRLFFVLIYD
jgi:hypothetical protein